MLDYFSNKDVEPAKPGTVIKGDSNKSVFLWDLRYFSANLFLTEHHCLRSKNKLGTCYSKKKFCRSLLKANRFFDIILSFYVPFI